MITLMALEHYDQTDLRTFFRLEVQTTGDGPEHDTGVPGLPKTLSVSSTCFWLLLEVATISLLPTKRE